MAKITKDSIPVFIHREMSVIIRGRIKSIHYLYRMMNAHVYASVEVS